MTSFKFQGGSGQFGSLVPLPAVPTLVEKGGDWTLQRLIRETEVFSKRECSSGRADRSGRARGRAGADAGEDRRARHHRPQGRWRGRRPLGHRARLPSPAGRARGPRLLRGAQPDLHGRDLRRRRREGEGSGDRRRHTRPHHDADEQPLGPAAHPRHRQGRRRSHRSGRVPAHRPQAGPASGPVRERHEARPQRDGFGLAARRPPFRQGHGLGPRDGMAHQDHHRRQGKPAHL